MNDYDEHSIGCDGVYCALKESGEAINETY